MFIGKEPQQDFNSLINEHGFKLKGVGTPTYYLGGDFYCDSDFNLAWGAHLYVSKMLSNYETLIGSKPKEFATPMIEKNHPEIDTSDLLYALGIKHCQSLIRALWWLVTLGRIYIHLGLATISTCCCAPRQVHLDWLKNMYSYLCRNPSGATRYRVKIPNHEGMATPVQYDLSSSVSGYVTDKLPNPYLEVSLCVLLPTRMTISAMTLSLVLALSILSTRHLVFPFARSRRL
jgi:hypothetical protein